jgi:hypothetical protein
MQRISIRGWFIIAGIGIVILLLIALLLPFHRGPQTADTPSAVAIATTTTGTNLTAVGPAASTSIITATSGRNIPTNIPATPGPFITISLITPISGNVWQIGTSNPIAWTQAANITGDIELLDAKTGAVVGVITSNTGPNQTAYSWDTRDIFLERYGADKKDVAPGIYLVRIHFDGNDLGDLVSGPITITN